MPGRGGATRGSRAARTWSGRPCSFQRAGRCVGAVGSGPGYYFCGDGPAVGWGLGAWEPGRCWRGLGWRAERSPAGGRAWSRLTPRARRCWCTSDLSSVSPAPARPRPWPGAVFYGACLELWSPGSSGPLHMAGSVELIIPRPARSHNEGHVGLCCAPPSPIQALKKRLWEAEKL